MRDRYAEASAPLPAREIGFSACKIIRIVGDAMVAAAEKGRVTNGVDTEREESS